jgi:5-formyltetrahydrofolate cyclo-ligase
MKDKKNIRKEIWEQLRKVAKPDSRFHWNFHEFIPDYEGSKKACDLIRNLDLYQNASFVMITPDNNLEVLREYCIRDKKAFVMPTYGIVRGFKFVRRDDVPNGQEAFASTLDGIERFGKSVSLTDIQKIGKVDFMVTGASVVNMQGIRFGKGHGYFDLEWAMFREIGVVNEKTPIIAVVHECQVIDDPIDATPYDTIVDIIATPERIIQTKKVRTKPIGVDWPALNDELLQLNVLQELKEIKGLK